MQIIEMSDAERPFTQMSILNNYKNIRFNTNASVNRDSYIAFNLKSITASVYLI